MSKPEDPHELKSFEAKLAALVPRDDRLDRERLAFLAGQASVAGRQVRTLKVLGLPLESRAWPTAFAAMTAVAATLLCMLMMRPEAPGVSHIAADVYQQDRPQISVEQAGRDVVLTTRDIHSAEIETRLAKLDRKRASDVISPALQDDTARPVYTPSAWQSVIHDTEPAKPLPHKSSRLSHAQGVTT